METIGRKVELNFLANAAKLYRTLLDLGLGHQHAINVVESKYQLSSVERQLLIRCISSKKDSKVIFKKLIPIEEINGKPLAIDFYNVAITISEALEGFSVYRCTDGLIRDLASAFGRSRKEQRVLTEIMKQLSELITIHDPDKIILVADKQISHSAEVLAEARNELLGKIKTEILLTSSSDSELIALSKMGSIVATSDILIVKNSQKILDLPKQFLLSNGLYGKNVIDLSSLIYIFSF